MTLKFRTAVLWWLLIIVIASPACKNSQFQPASKSSESAKSPRPTDEIEGVPGYLVDIESIEYIKEGEDTRIVGPNHSVKPFGNKRPDDVTIYVFRRDHSIIDAVYGVPIAKVKANSLGGFDIRSKEAVSTYIFVSTDSSHKPIGLDQGVQKKHSTIFMKIDSDSNFRSYTQKVQEEMRQEDTIPNSIKNDR